MSVTAGEYRYRLFISYSHHDDRWARWLHRSIERYKPPSGMQGRVSPVFRDREELPSASSLSDAVNTALEGSENLVIICSPAAAQSRWVNEEIRTFRRLGKADRIFCFIVDGEPHSGDASECFPPALTEDGNEPLAADARPGKDGRTLARLKLLAGLLGVGFDDLRQRDLQRRHRRLLGITTGALLMAVLTLSLAISAYLSNAEAERRREQAEDLIGFMVGDLYEGLHEIGRLDVFMSVGNKAMDYFSALADEDVNEEALHQRSDVLLKIGDTRLQQGELDAALQSFLQARIIAERLALSDPANPDWQIGLANTYFWAGFVHWQRGELEEAGHAFQQVLPIVDAVAEMDPANPDWLAEQSYAYTNYARVLELQGSLDSALDVYLEIERINQQALQLDPGNVDLRVEVGFAHNNIGKVVQALGRLEQAEQHFREDLRIKNEAVLEEPLNNLWQNYAATSHAYLGRVLLAQGRLEEAESNYQSALVHLDRLHQVDPENTNWTDKLASYSRELGVVHSQQQKYENAGTRLGEALAIYDALLAIDKSQQLWQVGRARTMVQLARLSLVESGSEQIAGLAPAREQAELAEQILSRLSDQEPSNTDLRKHRILAQLTLGDLFHAMGDEKAAASQWNQALQVLGPGASDHRNPEWLELSAAVLERLGKQDQAKEILVRLDQSGFKPTLTQTR